MSSSRKFFRTIVVVEILSERPFAFGNLSDIHYNITEGDCVGMVSQQQQTQHDGPEMVGMLARLGSDHSFFELDKNGNDIEN